MEILRMQSYPAAHFPFWTIISILGPTTFSLLLSEYFFYPIELGWNIALC